MNGLSRQTGSALAISGAVVALIGNLLAPRFDQDDNVDVYRAVADNDRLVPSGLVLLLAFLLTTAGILAIASSLRGGAGNDAAWLGGAVVAAGAVIAVAQVGIETFAYRQLAEAFAESEGQNQVSAFHAVAAVDNLNSALFSIWTILFLGLGPVLIGVAMLQSRAYPSWLALLGLLGGLLCLVVGTVNLVREDQSSLNLVFLVGSLLVTAWLLVGGLLLRREPATVAPA